MPADVWFLTAARAVNRLGAFTLPFLTVVLTNSFGASLGVAGLVVASFGAATIPSRIIGGYLANILGHRNTIAIGLTLTAVFQFLLAGAPNFATATGAAIMVGLSFEIYEPPSQTLVADVVESDRDRTTAYGLYSAALAAAGVFAGLLAAVLGGVNLRFLFVADGTTCLLCAALIMVGLRDRRVSSNGKSDRDSSRNPWRDPLLLALLVGGTGFAALYLQLDVALPLTLSADGIKPSLLGLLFVVSALTVVAGQPLMARGPVPNLGHFQAMALGFLLLGAGFALNGQVSSLSGFVLATVVWSLGDLVLLGRAYTLVAAIAPTGWRSHYMSAYGVSWGIAAMIGPILGTQLLRDLGVRDAWRALALLCIVLALAQLLLSKVARASGRLPLPPS